MIPWLIHFFQHPVVILSIGGAMGANARYWLAVWIRSRPWSASFPYGTFIANISGSLLLALLTGFLLERASPAKQLWFLLFGTGFCGAYTTFSTFELETVNLIRDGKWPLALFNVLGSVLAGFVAAVVGIRVAEGIRG